MTLPSDQTQDYPTNWAAPSPLTPAGDPGAQRGTMSPSVLPDTAPTPSLVVRRETPETYRQPTSEDQTPYPQLPQTSSLYVAAAILNWVMLGLVIISTMGVGIIAVVWMLPMTIGIHKGAKDGRKHTSLAVCTLLFCGLISGILMLVDERNRR